MIVVISKRLDYRGRVIDPLLLLATKRALEEMRGGEVLEMLSDDPAARLDITSWAKLTGHQLLEIDQRDNVYSFYIQKKL